MSLRLIVEAIESLEKDLTLFNLPPASRIAERLERFFETQNVRIRTAQTASGRPEEIAVLSRPEAVIALVEVDRLRELVDEGPPDSDLGIRDGAFEPFLTPLKETSFTAYDKRQMLATTREIEDRARRVGSGTIHTGFQRSSLMALQAPIYRDLADRGLTVHTYGVPDGAIPHIGQGTVHTPETDEIAQTWFVAFDGGTEPTQATALVAEERKEGQYYGVWTYDPAIVGQIVTHLEETYVVDSDPPTHAPS
ncbi:DICT sensory domain-containing protein [Halococcoides cellulosivorans]|uniref:Histidine kinase n=1 Tax=Halococcoides cellulosivorans TaxID=1679096 RepID=A0A2R4X2I5_9EURY|nr:DICT sensory domain-containing protein [Halococcoides cellulosivorans]AWB28029.1 histidine kinase [Halococcoides cellulosivorans]